MSYLFCKYNLITIATVTKTTIEIFPFFKTNRARELPILIKKKAQTGQTMALEQGLHMEQLLLQRLGQFSQQEPTRNTNNATRTPATTKKKTTSNEEAKKTSANKSQRHNLLPTSQA
jgi:DNA repair photolyase